MRSPAAPRTSIVLAATTAFAAFALIMSPAANAQTTYGPGPGGPLVDGTTVVGVFTTNIIVSAPVSQTIQSFNSVTLTNLTHTFLGDLEIRLTNIGTGAFVILTSPPDGRSSNFNGTYTFVVNGALPTIDEASLGLATAANIASGSYAVSSYGGGTALGPRGNYSAFTGLGIAGTWQLQIADFAPVDTGSLGSWQFNATTSAIGSSAPEPGTFALIGALLPVAGMIAHRRRRTK